MTPLYKYVAPNGSMYFSHDPTELEPIMQLYQSAEDRIRAGEAGPVAQLGQSFIDGCFPAIGCLLAVLAIGFVALMVFMGLSQLPMPLTFWIVCGIAAALIITNEIRRST